MVHDAQLVAFGDAGAAANEAIHFFREAALFCGEIGAFASDAATHSHTFLVKIDFLKAL